jgi:O-methyltransferase
MNALIKVWDRYQLERITRVVLPYTLVSRERIESLYRLARCIEKERIPGDVIECGVCNGGTAAILARFASRSRMKRTVWLMDSFEGMPQTTDEDRPAPDGDTAEAHIGKEVGDVSRVKEVLRRVRARMESVRIVPGWFQDTFPSVSAPRIALLNLDADWYESVKLCLDTFYDRVVPGGFVSIDDYGHWPGCRRAVDEFFHARQLPYKLHQVDYTGHWFRKE